MTTEDRPPAAVAPQARAPRRNPGGAVKRGHRNLEADKIRELARAGREGMEALRQALVDELLPPAVQVLLDRMRNGSEKAAEIVMRIAGMVGAETQIAVQIWAQIGVRGPDEARAIIGQRRELDGLQPEDAAALMERSLVELWSRHPEIAARSRLQLRAEPAVLAPGTTNGGQEPVRDSSGSWAHDATEP